MKGDRGKRRLLVTILKVLKQTPTFKYFCVDGCMCVCVCSNDNCQK